MSSTSITIRRVNEFSSSKGRIDKSNDLESGTLPIRQDTRDETLRFSSCLARPDDDDDDGTSPRPSFANPGVVRSTRAFAG